MTPVYLSSNFNFEGLGGKREYDYSRSGNPARDVLPEAQLEAGIKTTLLRLSVGIEHTPDLIRDISGALASASRAGLEIVNYA